MPLDPDDAARLRDIVSYGSKVGSIVGAVSLETFMVDTKTLFATCYGIQVVGEAAWKLSPAFQRSHPAIPWSLIASMRHRLVHDYGRADEAIIYRVATVHLPMLLSQVEAILAAGGGGMGGMGGDF